MRTILASTILGFCAALAAACSSEALDNGAVANNPGAGVKSPEPSAGQKTEASCASMVNALTSCGLLTGTRLAGCEEDAPVLPCSSACIAKATCTQLADAYCDSAFNSFAGCLNECQMALAPPDFVCDDGSEIPGGWQCDGAPDCVNSEDELGCPTFTCDSGVSIPQSWQCDAAPDCANGEDERGCAPGPTFTCADGATIPADGECDGRDDCSGAEDEIDCAWLTCP